jgi:hypothetical protein
VLFAAAAVILCGWPRAPNLPVGSNEEALWGVSGKHHRELRLFAQALSRMNDKKRKLLFGMAQKMAGANSK